MQMVTHITKVVYHPVEVPVPVIIQPEEHMVIVMIATIQYGNPLLCM
jgi:hypothetical protein